MPAEAVERRSTVILPADIADRWACAARKKHSYEMRQLGGSERI
jgi:hypothetical protein